MQSNKADINNNDNSEKKENYISIYIPFKNDNS